MTKSFAKSNTFKIVLAAIMIALGTVLSMVKLWRMPLGGSVTLCCMLSIMLVSWFLGVKWGLLTSFMFSVVQLLLSISDILSWGLTSTVVVASAILDYIIPYTVLGLCGLARNIKIKNSIVKFAIGMIGSVLIRFVSHVVSGAVLFAQWTDVGSWTFSLAYNGGFLGVDLLVCVIVGCAVIMPVEKLMSKYGY